MTEDASDTGMPAGATSPAGEDQDALEAARREAAENWERFLRTAAELENFRKRHARDVENARKFGAEPLAQALLPVRDGLEAALAATDSVDRETLVEGQRAIMRLLDEAFDAAGIRIIEPRGEPFDPAKHEAIGVLPAAHVAPNSVLEVMQTGYELNERLLRPARVIVAREPDDGSAGAA